MSREPITRAMVVTIGAGRVDDRTDAEVIEASGTPRTSSVRCTTGTWARCTATPAGATRALNDAGIVGRVVTSTADCTTGPNAVPINPADLYPPDTVHRLGDHSKVADGDTVTVRSSMPARFRPV